MQFSYVAILAFAAAAVAQSDCAAVAAKIPACALPCLASAIPKSGCSLTDYKCQCEAGNKATIQGAAQSCVLEKCADKAAEVLTAAQKVCECAANSSGGSSSSSSAGGSTGGSSTAGSSSGYPTASATSSGGAATGTGSASASAGTVSPSITPANSGSQVVVGLTGAAAGLIAALAL